MQAQGLKHGGEAVEAGRIASSRYISYLGILEDKESGKYRPEYK